MEPAGGGGHTNRAGPIGALRAIGWISLVGGILIAVMLLGTATRDAVDDFGGGSEIEWTVVALALGAALEGLLAWAVLHVLAAMSENMATMATSSRGGGPSPRAAGRGAPSPTAPAPGEPSAYEGEVQDVVDHHLGIQWGRTSSGQIVYREAGSETWRVFEPGTTSLVPPQSHRPEGS
jgi:hypothetical protein